MIRVLVVLLAIAARASAEDIPVREIYAVANQDSRFEVFAIASDGNLYHRWQNPERTEWSLWTLNTTGKLSRLRADRGLGRRVFVSALDSGHLIVRSQAAPNSAFGPQTIRSGHDLGALALGVDQDFRVEAFAIGSDGVLYSTNENSPGSDDWSDWHSLGGNDLLGGRPVPSGNLAPFTAITNGLAVARDGTDRLMAFAIGGDSALYTTQQNAPNGVTGWSAWTSLQGQDIHEISAVVDGEGKITIFAQDGNGTLRSLTQAVPGGGWRGWKTVFSQITTSWLATNRNGQIEVAAISFGNIKYRIEDLVGTWSESEMDIPAPAAAKLPLLGAISLVGTEKRGVALFVTDSSGEVYWLGRTPNSQWDSGGWRWLGSPSASPNDPDIVAQALSCLGDDVNQTLRDEVPGYLSSAVNSPEVTHLLSNVSIATVCENGAETIGMWLGHQATPEVLHGLQLTSDPNKPAAIEIFAYRVTTAGLNRVIGEEWTALPKRYSSSSGHPDANGDIELKSFSLNLASPNSLHLEIDGDLKSTFQLIIGVDSTFAVDNGLVKCDATLDVDAPGLHAGVELFQFLVPVYGLGAYDELEAIAHNQEMQLQPKAALVCKISDAFVSTILIPRDPSLPGPRKAISVVYDDINVDPQSGVTAFATSAPQMRDRVPTTGWHFVISSAHRDQSNKVTVGFAAEESDLRKPSYQWSAAASSAVVQDKGGNAPGQLVTVTFSIPANAVLKGLNLGDLTVTATDLDGQIVRSKHQVILNDFVLNKPPPVYKTPPKVLRPARP
jgi:hypothetical protein